jgi:hypothetical protein
MKSEAGPEAGEGLAGGQVLERSDDGAVLRLLLSRQPSLMAVVLGDTGSNTCEGE